VNVHIYKHTSIKHFGINVLKMFVQLQVQIIIKPLITGEPTKAQKLISNLLKHVRLFWMR